MIVSHTLIGQPESWTLVLISIIIWFGKGGSIDQSSEEMTGLCIAFKNLIINSDCWEKLIVN